MTSTVSGIEGLARVSGIAPSDQMARTADLHDVSARLSSIPERARKLLAHIAEMAYHGRGQGRKTDVAYLPELYESTGLDVESMYELLKQLQAARFIAVEDRYPFEEAQILPCPSGWNALAAISQFSEAEKIPIHDIIVDVHFELLQ